MDTFSRQHYANNTPSQSTLQSAASISPPLPKSFSSTQSPAIITHPFLPPIKSTPSPISFTQSIPISTYTHNPHPLILAKPLILPKSSTYRKSKSITPQPKSFLTGNKRTSHNKNNNNICHLPMSSLIAHDGTLKTHGNSNIFITKDNDNSQRDSLSPSEMSQSPSPALINTTDSDSDSNSDIEVLGTSQLSPTPMPISFSSKKRKNNSNTNSHTPATKKRKLNILNPSNSIDLCDDSDDGMNMCYAHIDNPKTIQMINDTRDTLESSDIDVEDKEVLLYGISIGTHAHHWIPGAGAGAGSSRRPKIKFNKYESKMNIYLNSTNNEYVPVTVHADNIGNLIIPKDPSFFRSDDTIDQYINVIFMVLNTPLKASGWLDGHFCPKNKQYDAQSPSQAFITIYIDAYSFEQFRSIVLSKYRCSLLDRFVAELNNDNKYQMLKLVPMTNIIYDKWKKINAEKIHENDKREADSDDTMNVIVPVEDMKGNDAGAESDSASSLSSKFEWDNTSNNSNKKEILTDYKLYIKNREYIVKPHHDNSLLYVINVKKEPYYKDEKCYWFFPSQYGHNCYPYVIRQEHLYKLKNKKWLNDDIINFGIKYLYASWPHYIKRNVYIFSSYWYASISKILYKANIKYNNITEKMKKDVAKQTKSFVNLFDREYILIPICDDQHWELMIIYNINNVWDNRNNNNICNCHIITLDSLNQNQRAHKDMFDRIKIWLNIMAESKGYKGTLFGTYNTITKCIEIPEQPNGDDCGCFLLRNVYQFGKDNGINVNVKNLKKWYTQNDGVKYRYWILDVMNDLVKEQEKYVIEIYKMDQINKNKKKKKRAKKSNNIIERIE